GPAGGARCPTARRGPGGRRRVRGPAGAYRHRPARPRRARPGHRPGGASPGRRGCRRRAVAGGPGPRPASPWPHGGRAARVRPDLAGARRSPGDPLRPEAAALLRLVLRPRRRLVERGVRRAGAGGRPPLARAGAGAPRGAAPRRHPGPGAVAWAPAAAVHRPLDPPLGPGPARRRRRRAGQPAHRRGHLYAVATGALAGRTAVIVPDDGAGAAYGRVVRRLLARHLRTTAALSRLSTVPGLLPAGLRAAAA